MSDTIPPIPQPTIDVNALAEEEKQFADLDHFERVDIRLRECAGYIALAFVVTFWLAAVCMVIFMYLHIHDPKLPSDSRWTAVVALIVALFSAPTVIVLAVLNSTKKKPADNSEPTTIPQAQIVDVVIKAAKELR